MEKMKEKKMMMMMMMMRGNKDIGEEEKELYFSYLIVVKDMSYF